MWRFIAQDFAWPKVKRILYILNHFGGQCIKARLLGKVLPYQSISMLVQTSLPRMIGLGKITIYSNLSTEFCKRELMG